MRDRRISEIDARIARALRMVVDEKMEEHGVDDCAAFLNVADNLAAADLSAHVPPAPEPGGSDPGGLDALREARDEAGRAYDKSQHRPGSRFKELLEYAATMERYEAALDRALAERTKERNLLRADLEKVEIKLQYHGKRADAAEARVRELTADLGTVRSLVSTLDSELAALRARPGGLDREKVREITARILKVHTRWEGYCLTVADEILDAIERCIVREAPAVLDDAELDRLSRLGMDARAQAADTKWNWAARGRAEVRAILAAAGRMYRVPLDRAAAREAIADARYDNGAHVLYGLDSGIDAVTDAIMALVEPPMDRRGEEKQS